MTTKTGPEPYEVWRIPFVFEGALPKLKSGQYPTFLSLRPCSQQDVDAEGKGADVAKDAQNGDLPDAGFEVCCAQDACSTMPGRWTFMATTEPSSRAALCTWGDGGAAERRLLENISAMFLGPGSILYEEPANLIKQEVAKASSYNAVIAAIASGASQHNEIAAKAGLDSSALDYCLKGLARIDLLQRVEPIGGKGGRKALRQIKDNLFRFWYRSVGPRRAMIERGMGDMVAPAIEKDLPLFMGPVFSKSPFTAACAELARSLPAARLVTFDEMVGGEAR